MNNLFDAFISYGRADSKAFATKLHSRLVEANLKIWFDQNDIPLGVDYQNQADNVVYLLSPESVNSDYCQQELDYTLSLHKRVIPVLVRETNSQQVPIALRNLQYIDLTDNVKEEDYLLDESQLLKILYQDAAYYEENANVSFLNNGQNLVTWLNKDKVSYGAVQLWKANGTLIKTLIKKNQSQGYVRVRVSKDGQFIVTSIN